MFRCDIVVSIEQQRNPKYFEVAPLSSCLQDNRTLILSSESFPDPYDYVVHPNGLTIEFYGYRDTVTYTDLYSCMRRANDDVMKEVKAGRTQSPMGEGPFVYDGGQATLYLSPDEHLTWSKWSLAPGAITKFVLANGLKGTQFILLWRGLGPVGYGHLVATSETDDDNIVDSAKRLARSL